VQVHRLTSDKIARWNVLGLAGALLYNLLEPVYLDGLVIGDMFDKSELERSLNHRILSSQIDTTEGFRINALNITWTDKSFKWSLLTVRSLPDSEPKGCNTAVSWCKDESAEVIVNGRKQGAARKHGVWNLKSRSCILTRSLVCKSCLFELYQQVSGQSSLTYYECKQAAQAYQAVKCQLYESALKGWIVAPPQYECFSLSHPESEKGVN
jgi:tRNA-specific adenosine deaminase 1